MNDLIAEARARADDCRLGMAPLAASLLRRLADALERSEARAERMRVERGRLAMETANMCWEQDLEPVAARRWSAVQAIIGCMRCDRTFDPDLAAELAEALAAHDREMEGRGSEH